MLGGVSRVFGWVMGWCLPGYLLFQKLRLCALRLRLRATRLGQRFSDELHCFRPIADVQHR